MFSSRFLLSLCLFLSLPHTWPTVVPLQFTSLYTLNKYRLYSTEMGPHCTMGCNPLLFTDRQEPPPVSLDSLLRCSRAAPRTLEVLLRFIPLTCPLP